MIVLKDNHPDVHGQFLKGKAVKKTTCSFSAIAFDQAHKQNNASVKGDSDAVGLTENPAALRRWMLSGPEMARVVGEFEASTEKRKKTDTRHHEQTKHAQMAFARDVKALTGAIEDMGNPCCEKSIVDLLVLDIRDLADAAVIDTLNQIEKLGQDQYDTYKSVLTILTCSQLEHVSRVDVVWDEYFPESLKAETRSKRGKGVHRHVEPSSVIPGNWPEFLHIEDKKAELFSFLATSVTAFNTGKQIISICTMHT
ncbi:hypothetical protein NQZ68_030800 [Dissostichus eleginoides]|nr:hypothetical protein NQZ68_030800 [Dissostichus eleginoides]